MSSIYLPPSTVLWRASLPVWCSLALAAALLFLVFEAGIRELLVVWDTRPEYSYGYIIPFVSLFLLWQRRDALERLPATGAWTGVGLVAFAVALRIVGDLATSTVLIEYGFVIAILGLALAYLGWPGFRVALVPLLMLGFMVPLPQFAQEALSRELQLLSSALGVSLIRLCGISVHLDGNVIDLGTMQLQVAEACNGLRYLFPLTALSAIAAYLFRGEPWKRLVILLSAIPITVLMNSFRIGLIGITVEFWGPAMAEGFLHDFEGWAIFMASTGMLVVLMWTLARVGRVRRPLAEMFALELPAPAPAGAPRRTRTVPGPLFVAVALLAGALALIAAIPDRGQQLKPERRDFGEFPLRLAGWEGRRERIDPVQLEVLKADDAISANYLGADRAAINLHIAYFASQSRGAATHSPRVCIPGAGWDITRLETRELAAVRPGGAPLRVNRALIQKGDAVQLVYYWFKHGERVVTHEYVAKWIILVDSLTRNRSDGALIRLITPVRRGEPEGAADERLAAFAAALAPALPRHVPD
jgi:exosortase D (VPLPA-CTERM-specific)